jgi:hypothetical protein
MLKYLFSSIFLVGCGLCAHGQQLPLVQVRMCETCRVFLPIGQKVLREAKNGGSSQSMHWLERKHDLARAKSSNHSRPKFPIHTFVSIRY